MIRRFKKVEVPAFRILADGVVNLPAAIVASGNPDAVSYHAWDRPLHRAGFSIERVTEYPHNPPVRKGNRISCVSSQPATFQGETGNAILKIGRRSGSRDRKCEQESYKASGIKSAAIRPQNPPQPAHHIIDRPTSKTWQETPHRRELGDAQRSPYLTQLAVLAHPYLHFEKISSRLARQADDCSTCGRVTVSLLKKVQ